MTRSRRARDCRTPSREELVKILYLGFELDELFIDDETDDDDEDEEVLVNLLAAARRRVIAECFYATEKNPRFKPGSDRSPRQRTDNYIWGVSKRPSELAVYVERNMHRPFIRPLQLPPELRELSDKMVQYIISRAHRDLLTLAIQEMRNRGEIWYDEATGVWQVCQSSVDEFLHYRRVVKALKVEHREFHGRPRRQSDRRQVPPGVSVSYA